MTDTYTTQLAERLAAEWASERHTVLAVRDVDLSRWILTQLADPTSDCGDLLDDLCRERWTAPVPLRVVEALPREHAGDGGPGCGGGAVPRAEGPVWDVVTIAARELGDPGPVVSS